MQSHLTRQERGIIISRTGEITEIMEQSAQKPSWAITDGNFIVCRPHSSLCPDEPKKEIDCEEGVQEVGSGEKLLVKSVQNISEFKLSLRVLRYFGQQPVMMGAGSPGMPSLDI